MVAVGGDAAYENQWLIVDLNSTAATRISTARAVPRLCLSSLPSKLSGNSASRPSRNVRMSSSALLQSSRLRFRPALPWPRRSVHRPVVPPPVASIHMARIVAVVNGHRLPKDVDAGAGCSPSPPVFRFPRTRSTGSSPGDRQLIDQRLRMDKSRTTTSSFRTRKSPPIPTGRPQRHSARWLASATGCHG